MFAVTHAACLLGTEAIPVRVETRVERGLPTFTIVGLREVDARAARERVRCGLLAIGLDLPLERVTVSLAPADLPKAGASFDLAIAIGILAAMGVLPAKRVARVASHAEVGLDGTLRPVLGGMAVALLARRMGWRSLLVAPAAAGRAAEVDDRVRAPESIEQVVGLLTGRLDLPAPQPTPRAPGEGLPTMLDLDDVRGNGHAVHALEVAAAGGHNLLLHGPPGSGKTMLASRLPGVLPELDEESRLEVATIHDAAGIERRGDEVGRPFRAPHHSVSQAALVGGGSERSYVGELTLAHRGVLFLDELPEFRPSAIDGLRQPLEERAVVVRRARWMVRYPADVQVVAAMNECRCGNWGAAGRKACTCTDVSRRAYQQRVSGALRDRFDLHVPVPAPQGSITQLPAAPPSSEVRARVAATWQVQAQRWGVGRRSAHVRVIDAATFRFEPGARDLLLSSVESRGLGGRTQAALVRVARTLADLRNVVAIGGDVGGDLDRLVHAPITRLDVAGALSWARADGDDAGGPGREPSQATVLADAGAASASTATPLRKVRSATGAGVRPEVSRA